MAKAHYLSYPKLESLLAAGVNRQQTERSVSSYEYIILCRHTMQERMGEQLTEPSIGMIGESNGEESLATIFYYLSTNSFNEPTGLNGPIKSFAEQELAAFRIWGAKNHALGSSLSGTVLTSLSDLQRLTKLWIDNLSPHAPRTLWFLYAIQDPLNNKLREDLREWTILDKAVLNKAPGTNATIDDPTCAGWANMIKAANNPSPTWTVTKPTPAATEGHNNVKDKPKQDASVFAKVVLVWEIIFGCIGSLLSALNNPHPNKWAFMIAVGLVTVVPLLIAHLAAEGENAGDRDKEVLKMADGFAGAGFGGSFFIIAVLR